MQNNLSFLRKFLKTFILSFLIINSLPAQPIGSESGPRSSQINSPYTRYGIGDWYRSINTEYRGSGGIATSIAPQLSINSFNPASYSYLTAATLDAAFEGNRKNVFLGGKSTNSGTGNFSYFNLGMNAGKYAGFNIGFKPMAGMFYNANDTLFDPITGSTIKNFNGAGNLQYAFLGLSGKYKGFSIGTNVGYAFGLYQHAASFNFPVTDTSGSLNSYRNVELSTKDRQGGIYWTGGLMYQNEIVKDHILSVGFTANLSQNLNVNREVYSLGYHTISDYSSIETIIDTIEHSNTKGTLTLPASYNFGISFGKKASWEVGADFNYTDWASFSNMGDRAGVGNNSWRGGLGGSYTPDAASADKKYYSYITYHLGGYVGKDYYNINNTNVHYYGGTIGASLPLQRSYNNFGKVHLALDIGSRGSIQNGLAKELFTNFTFGLSLNDTYWLKRPAHYK